MKELLTKWILRKEGLKVKYADLIDNLEVS
jgi:hypothetical protein